jgi:hypothetical protein
VLASPYHPSLNATELLQFQLNDGWLTKTELSKSRMSNSHVGNDYHRSDWKEGQSPYMTENTDYKQKMFE